jgi:hypothetical protein
MNCTISIAIGVGMVSRGTLALIVRIDSPLDGNTIWAMLQCSPTPWIAVGALPQSRAMVYGLEYLPLPWCFQHVSASGKSRFERRGLPRIENGHD